VNSQHHFLAVRRFLCGLLAILPGDRTPARCIVRDMIVRIDERLGEAA